MHSFSYKKNLHDKIKIKIKIINRLRKDRLSRD